MRRPLIALVVTVALAACASSDTKSLRAGSTPSSTAPAAADESSTTSSSTGSAPSIAWEDSGDVQEAHLEVPLDYAEPDGPKVELYLVRHPATNQNKRIGSLLVNPGGPGVGGTYLAYIAPQLYSPALLERFDIVAWDPRGTGLTTPAIDCIGDDEYDKYYAEPDAIPSDAAEKQAAQDLAKSFADACTTKNADIIQHVGTNDTARDMDSIRRALGEDKISYFGISYGSELGATWATMFPDTVRAAVLDGASDPNADFYEGSIQQTKGFEAALSTFLKQCAANKSCAFYNGGDTEAAFDELMAKLEVSPVPTVSGRPPANQTVAIGGVVQAMYTDQYWPMLEQALADAQDGNGAGLLDLFDQYFQRQADGSYTNDLEAFQTIHCMDAVERPTVAEDDAQAVKIHKIAPRLAPAETGSYFCTFFPKAASPRIAITGKGAGPILVMGTTGDAATPLASTEAMAATLEDGRLVTVTADRHGGYTVNSCSRKVVDNYLIDPVKNAPAGGETC